MKTVFVFLETKSERWVTDAVSAYQKKIQGFLPFEVLAIKSPSAARDSADLKKKAEADKVLKWLQPQDQMILFDEGGTLFNQSELFANAFKKVLDRSPSRLVFLIGGAYGVDERVRARASAVWSLSPLTMNHWVAQITALEQIYRALTIQRKIPYHNR